MIAPAAAPAAALPRLDGLAFPESVWTAARARSPAGAVLLSGRMAGTAGREGSGAWSPGTPPAAAGT